MAHRSRMEPFKTGEARAMRRRPTSGEAALWETLRKERMGVKFRRQAPMLGFIADFYAPSIGLVIEVDGGYHHEGMQRRSDAVRDAAMRRAGMKVVRVPNEAAVNARDLVRRVIAKAIADRQADPAGSKTSTAAQSWGSAE